MINVLNDWFDREIFVHERSLRRLISGRVVASQVDDVLQEVFVNVLEVAMCHPITEPQAYVFTAARNLLNDRARRRHVHMISVHDGPQRYGPPAALVDDVTPERSLSGLQQLVRLEGCLGKLPNRCREAVLLHKIQGLSQKETAQRMGNSEKTVEQQLVVGMRRLTRCFNSDDPRTEPKSSWVMGAKIGAEHGN
jgi:RNA polymerase sigma factor (sigma-70 family)